MSDYYDKEHIKMINMMPLIVLTFDENVAFYGNGEPMSRSVQDMCDSENG